jgi:hypothetical protein
VWRGNPTHLELGPRNIVKHGGLRGVGPVHALEREDARAALMAAEAHPLFVHDLV